MKQYHKIQTVFKRDPETRHKNLLFGEYSRPEFQYLDSAVWEFTEKVDGTNIRIMLRDGELSFGGKTDRAQLPSPLVKFLERHFLPQVDFFKSNLEEVCLYGEGYGAGIQKGGNYRPDQSFVLFDVKVEELWLRREDVNDIADELKIESVPSFGEGTLHEMVEICRKGFASTWGSLKQKG